MSADLTRDLLEMEKLRLCGIYRIRNTVNGKLYVGSAVDVPKRWRGHRQRLNKGTHRSPRLQSAWNKYGHDAFSFDFIEVVERNKTALDSREQVHLNDAFAAGLAYNICRTAGSRLGVPHTEETRAKIGDGGRNWHRLALSVKSE